MTRRIYQLNQTSEAFSTLMSKYFRNQINQHNSFATLGGEDFTCVHQKQLVFRNIYPV